MNTVYLENTFGNHNKFYRMYENRNKTFTAEWGKIGKDPQGIKDYPMSDWYNILDHKKSEGYDEDVDFEMGFGRTKSIGIFIFKLKRLRVAILRTKNVHVDNLNPLGLVETVMNTYIRGDSVTEDILIQLNGIAEKYNK
jgi:predicted DNA-binding WGR domain protein